MPGIPTEDPTQRAPLAPVDGSQTFGSSSGHVLRNEHNIVETGMTSIKVHQRPGGNSSIDLFGGNDYGQSKPEVPAKP